MASSATQTITIEAQVAEAIKALVALDGLFKQLGVTAKRELGENLKPAKQGVDDLEGSLRKFKSGQVGQGKLVGFYIGEVGDFVQMSKGAQAALTGLAGAMLEFATGAGPVAGAMAGMELIKGAIGAIREESKKSAEAMKKFFEETTKAVDAGRQAAGSLLGGQKSRLTELTGGDPKLEEARKSAIEAAKALQEFKRQYNLLGKDVETDISGLGLPAEVVLKWAELEKKVKATRDELRKYVEMKPEVDAIAGGEYGPGNKKGLEAFLSDSKAVTEQTKKLGDAAAEAAKKVRELTAISLGLTDAILGDEFAPGTDLRHPASQVAREAEKNAKKALAEYNRAQMETEGGMFGPGNAKGELTFYKESGEAIANMAEAWSAVGGAVSDAATSFAALGAAIGGAAGEMVGQLMEVITAAIKTAVAFASVEAAKTPFIGWLTAGAAAVSLAATLVATIGGISARATGGPVRAGVPYLVGERGPEIVVPSSSGTVIPNDRLGGGSVNVTFNAPVDQVWWRNNERHIVRTLRDAVRSGRA